MKVLLLKLVLNVFGLLEVAVFSDCLQVAVAHFLRMVIGAAFHFDQVMLLLLSRLNEGCKVIVQMRFLMLMLLLGLLLLRQHVAVVGSQVIDDKVVCVELLVVVVVGKGVAGRVLAVVGLVADHHGLVCAGAAVAQVVHRLVTHLTEIARARVCRDTDTQHTKRRRASVRS